MSSVSSFRWYRKTLSVSERLAKLENDHIATSERLAAIERILDRLESKS